jgi:hypothetical protein
VLGRDLESIDISSKQGEGAAMAAENDDSSSSGALPPGTMAAVGELIKASADNPNIKAAGGELGKAAFTVAKAINVVLLPIAAINYGYERARDYFQGKFETDLNEKLADVSPDDIVEPKPSLAGPVMQGLAFSHDEQALRDMYLNLLASAMNRRAADSTHPAFVEIIKQLTAEEAEALCAALSPPLDKEIAQVRLNMPAVGGWRVLLNHLMPVTAAATRRPTENPKLPAMVDNWIRLGLVDVSYAEFLQNDPNNMTRYAWAQERPEFKRIKAQVEQSVKPAGATVIAAPGRFRNTAFGDAFYRAVGLDKILQKALAEIRSANAQTPP